VAPTEQSTALARTEGTDVAAPAVTRGNRRPQPAAPASTPAAAAPAQTAAIVGKARVQFAPIVGASVEAATPLTQRLGISRAANAASRSPAAPTPAHPSCCAAISRQ
jgi:hypothetical protein